MSESLQLGWFQSRPMGQIRSPGLLMRHPGKQDEVPGNRLCYVRMSRRISQVCERGNRFRVSNT